VTRYRLIASIVTVGVLALTGCGSNYKAATPPAAKTTPTLTWNTPAPVAYGTALGSTQLNAFASVVGTFSYSPSAGTVLTAGSQTLSVAFTPNDTADYNTVSASVTLSVGQTVPVITWAPLKGVPVGTVLGAAELDATVNGVPGSFTYSPAAGTVLTTAGTTTITATFVPTDTVNYATVTATNTIQVIAPVTPTKPDYAWSNVKVVGGGYVTGITFHPTEKGLMYARTDIGGAYRWGPHDSQWVPLLDFISPATWWYGGVEALGVDPTDANRLYLAVGEYANEAYDGNGAMLISDDQGKTFTTVPLGFRNGSNDSGRGDGERIAVDQNLPSTVYFGTRLAGLQMSADHGATWNKVTGLGVTATGNGSGVVSVLPVKRSGSSGAATPVIYAAVGGTGTSGDPVGLFVTTAGGNTSGVWIPVLGQPQFTTAGTPLAPEHAVFGAGGSLYVLYADAAGPEGITTSQLWKFTPGTNWTSGTWTQIVLPVTSGSIPSQLGFGGIVADPNLPGTLLLSTIDQYAAGDTIYRTTDAGASWTDVSLTGGMHDGSLSPWIAFGGSGARIGTGNWATSLAIDPFDSDHALYGTGSTIWNATNLTATNSGDKVAWSIGAEGVEETAVNFVLAPPSGDTVLLSSMRDIAGFAHTDLRQSPAQGMFEAPQATPTSMDFAQKTPTTVVRVSDGRNGASSPTGDVSFDGGLTWAGFATTPAGSQGGGQIAIATDGSSMVWATQDTASVWYSGNGGVDWKAAAGIAGQAQVVSDRVKARTFYGYFGDTLYASSDGGATWSAVQAGLPVNGKLYILPDSQGDVWLAAGKSGLYRNTGTLSDPALTAMPGVTNAQYLGFGLPAAGTTDLTLFLYGTVGSTTGLFRSKDSGMEWLQINDAEHQWGGGVNGITGDMRSFGTVYVSTNGRGIIWGTSAY
jgi:hypothetical protein